MRRGYYSKIFCFKDLLWRYKNIKFEISLAAEYTKSYDHGMPHIDLLNYFFLNINALTNMPQIDSDTTSFIEYLFISRVTKTHKPADVNFFINTLAYVLVFN